MTAAADTWNAFFTATQGIPAVMDYGGTAARTSTQPVPTSLCAEGIIQGLRLPGRS